MAVWALGERYRKRTVALGGLRCFCEAYYFILRCIDEMYGWTVPFVHTPIVSSCRSGGSLESERDICKRITTVGTRVEGGGDECGARRHRRTQRGPKTQNSDKQGKGETFGSRSEPQSENKRKRWKPRGLQMWAAEAKAETEAETSAGRECEVRGYSTTHSGALRVRTL